MSEDSVELPRDLSKAMELAGRVAETSKRLNFEDTEGECSPRKQLHMNRTEFVTAVTAACLVMLDEAMKLPRERWVKVAGEWRKA